VLPKISKVFLRRRWLDFRNGHSIYLAFFLTFVNFILITYNFAIKQLPFGIGDYMSLPLFVLIFVSLYAPAAIILGVWHRKHQYSVENEALLRQNWMWAWIMQYQIRLIQGKTNPKEDALVISYLNEVLVRTNKSELVGKNDNVNPLSEGEGDDKK
jgi:hypothetical protein